jgi:hypothetical protein
MLTHGVPLRAVCAINSASCRDSISQFDLVTTVILICASCLAVLLHSRIITQTTARVREEIASCNFASLFFSVCLSLIYCVSYLKWVQ